LDKVSKLKGKNQSAGCDTRSISNFTESGKISLLIKRGIWIYFFLLIFEGALRKWFLPGLATPLMIIRDPLALWLLFMIWKKGMLPANAYLISFLLIGIISIVTATLLGHGSMAVALFGARAYLIHIPFIFVIGSIFNHDDVIKIGKATIWLAIPMTVLIAFQFSNPQSAWVNQGVGGDIEGAGFGGAMGYYRPPATFSFTNGTTLFYSLLVCFILYFWVGHGKINRIVLLCATLGLLLAIPLSISRGLFFQVGVSLIFTLIAVSRKPIYLSRMVMACVIGFVAITLLSNIDYFQTATKVFTSRFETASKEEGGLEGTLLNRYLGDILRSLIESSDTPFFGHGLGMGTNAGSKLLTGKREFLIAEGEWARTIGELGPLLGLSVVFLRMGLSAKIALACYRKLVIGDMLPWLLLSVGLTLIVQGGWAQPTALGFFSLTTGLLIASLRPQKTVNSVIEK